MTLLDRRLLVNTGKGGVGKSTVTAALALVAAARGKRVLVCEVNTKERIAPLLGARPVGHEIGPVGDGIDSVVVRPKEAMREYALMKLKFRAVYHAVFENRLVSRFLAFIPSLSELVTLGKILFHVREQRWDVVLVDAPATGHAITFLRIPQALIDTVPPGAMRSDAEWMRDLLVDPEQTALNLVALPEEMPYNETVELAAVARDLLRMDLGAVFLNATRAVLFDAAERRLLAAGHAADDLLDCTLRAGHEYSIRADLSAHYHDKLAETIGRPVVDLPLLSPRGRLGHFGRSQIEELAGAIEGALR